MRVGFASILALTLVAARPAAGDGPAELQWRWELVSVEADGRATVLKEGRPRWEIAGDTIRYGTDPLAIFTADPGASPKVIDLRFVGPMRVLEGIYAVEGDTLKVCLNKRADGEKDRPHAFATKGKDNWRLLVFRRVAEREGDRDGRGFVGLALRFDKERDEIVVEQTLEDSPAARAGLKKGDVVLTIAGERPTGIVPAVEAVRRQKPGGSLPLRIRREGKEQEVKVQVGLLPFGIIADLE